MKVLHLFLVGNLARLTWVMLQQPQEQRYPFLPMCSVPFVCPNDGMAASAWEFLMCTQILMHAIAHGGCKNTPRESALQVDVGRKIHGCTDWGVELVCVCVCVWLALL